ncbi:MAG: tetratricopeptide repeat protein [Cyanobacteria bacterium CRU_2_1]|nr:tetratricopeptide repeat protein [Cyanobacteria bacterium RU_5_0]NJR57551.1 tetratricopeptide repeat protein [Cyanobacteria bacterium CRU_2_1]
MSESVETLFDQGIERYKAGESPDTLIPMFKEICDRAPKSSAAWTCLSWLYLLDGKPTQAYKAAQKAVKLNPQDPQARVNLAMAMLETAQTGVRQHVEIAGQVLLAAPELREEVEGNLEEGLSRKPNWKSLSRVKSWLFESE